MWNRWFCLALCSSIYSPELFLFDSIVFLYIIASVTESTLIGGIVIRHTAHLNFLTRGSLFFVSNKTSSNGNILVRARLFLGAVTVGFEIGACLGGGRGGLKTLNLIARSDLCGGSRNLWVVIAFK